MDQGDEQSNPAGAVDAPIARLSAIESQGRRATDQHRSLRVL
jgi:hypothetical protein